jgi:hypothetical protein
MKIFFARTVLTTLAFAGSLSAGTVPLKVNATNSTATIVAPKNSTKLLVEVKDSKNAAWRVYKNLSIRTSPATVQVALPQGYQSKSWRATVGTASIPSTKAKYPQKFFNGKKAFTPVVAPSYAAGSQTVVSASGAPVSVKTTSTSVVTTSASGPVAMADTVSVANSQATAPATATAVEADIWKVDGTTAYYFNQYRGLQVIDLADPANPTLKAYYRLPAKGQDLYIVPGQGDARQVILITSEANGSTGVNLFKVEGSKVTPLSNLPVSGWMADSRMVGNRLYLATQTWGWYWSYDCVTSLNEVVVDGTAGTLSAGSQFAVGGSWPVISAGGDWLAVSTSDWNDWQTSKITLFTLGDSGATRSADAVRLFGRVYDKDHLGCDGGRFSAVSERWIAEDGSDSWWWNGSRVTTLQNFSMDGSPLASLEIQRGEALYATKFQGNKAYVVTALQVDPLFVIDLSDATNPVLAGQLEVPGRSTRIVPVSSDQLFTIGFDGGNKVCASLFGVSDPSNPTLLGRVSLGGIWGYSAATYDDKALKVLPESGIVLIPYTSYSDSWVSQQYVQILKLDSSLGSLALGGTITNRFDPLRASVVGNTAVSISQKDLVTADISNPDSPSVLADLLLAWPVNRVLESGGHLFQISDGSSWYGNGPNLVVTRSDDPDTVVGELDLGEGTVRDAAATGGTLRVLRQKDSSLILDIYGIGSPSSVIPLGSATTTLSGSSWDLQVGKMLNPSSNCVVSVVQPNSRCWYGWGYPPIAIDPLPVIGGPVAVMASGVVSPVASSIATPSVALRASSAPVAVDIATTEVLPVTGACVIDYRNWWGGVSRTSQSASAVIFRMDTPAAPVALPSVTLTDTNAGSVNVSEAGGGLLVIGYGDEETPRQWKRLPYHPIVFSGTVGSPVVSSSSSGDYTLLSSAKHHLRVLDLLDPSAPVLGPVQDLPGRLLAVSDLTRDGFLTWSESCSTGRQVQVSACSGATLSQVTSTAVDFGAPVVAAGRSFFTATTTDSGAIVTRRTLADSGAFLTTGSLSLGWYPATIRVTGSGPNLSLFGTDGVNLFGSLWNASGPVTPANSSWKASLGFDPTMIAPLQGGGVAVPEGDYGIEVFRP